MAQIGLYGGAFNPPHLAHVFTVTYLLGRADIDQVWLLPTADHVFGKALTPFAERVALLERLVASLSWEDRVHISGFEAEREGLSRTFDTLTLLSARHPAHSFVWVMGSDNLTESHRWHRFDDLVARWPVIVLGRHGHEAALAARADEAWCRPGPTLPSISSTRLRAALRGHGDPADLDWLPAVLLADARRLYPAEAVPSRGRVQVLGLGRAGAAFAGALRRAGYTVDTWNRTPREAADASGPLPSSMPAGVWLLCVDDGAIPPLARALAARTDAPGRTVLHCAGRLGREALAPLADRGCATGSLHPLQSLRGVRDRLAGTYFAVEGDAGAIEEARALVEAMGGHPVSLPEGGKAAYHAAAVLSANFATALGAGGGALLEALGVSESMARAMLVPLLQGTVDHLAQAPAREALTGPFARRDFAAVAAHVEAIDNLAPQWRETYAALARVCAKIMGWTERERAELDDCLSPPAPPP